MDLSAVFYMILPIVFFVVIMRLRKIAISKPTPRIHRSTYRQI